MFLARIEDLKAGDHVMWLRDFVTHGVIAREVARVEILGDCAKVVFQDGLEFLDHRRAPYFLLDHRPYEQGATESSMLAGIHTQLSIVAENIRRADRPTDVIGQPRGDRDKELKEMLPHLFGAIVAYMLGKPFENHNPEALAAGMMGVRRTL